MKNFPNQNQLLDPLYDPEEIYVRSTQVKRTIQSAYAQLLGFFPLGIGEELLEELNQNSMPHINISGKSDILSELGTHAILDNMQPVPVRNFDQYVDDMIAYGGCPFIVNDYLRRDKDPKTWEESDEFYRPLIYAQLAEAFGLDKEELQFMDIYQYTDTLFAEDFEGIQNRFNFTGEEWEVVLSMQVPLLVELLSDLSNRIISLRYIFPIVELMRKNIGLSYNQTMVEDFGDPKFVLFSSHDYQLIHILKFLNPSNHPLQHVKYASIMLFELHQIDKDSCINSKSQS